MAVCEKLFVENPPFVFYFRVKFYVSEPSKLKEEYTRYVVGDFSFHIYMLKAIYCDHTKSLFRE